MLINTHLLQSALKHGCQKFFYSSSARVYNGDKQKTFEAPSLKEADAYPAQPEDGYGWEKLFSERMCRHFREDFGLYTRVARFHNVYGPWGTWFGGREKAPAAICRKVPDPQLHVRRRLHQGHGLDHAFRNSRADQSRFDRGGEHQSAGRYCGRNRRCKAEAQIRFVRAEGSQRAE
jgi:nucleoside-diphosphate-sugar epimerase